ncbi:DNA replication complex GINS protein PSF1-like isoform X2 [Gordionus sp. m RMFG-2023]|uniref:DNA replication complex GINS protein PSF1-like isoform X2 n=1 Tax=Gordionus sp. m RMFG-2023 TaxID=3053472 RepID=UPI0031FCF8CA
MLLIFNMDCRSSIDLIKELNINTLKIFNEKKIKEIYDEMRHLFQLNEIEASRSLNEDISSNFSTLLVRHACLERHRRCIFNYILMFIKERRWDHGIILPTEIKKNINKAEVNLKKNIFYHILLKNKWFIKYTNSINKYLVNAGLSELGFNMIYSKKPPKSTYIQVRCLKDYIDYGSENGEMINFKENSQHFLSRSQCEPLIQKGILKHII